VADVHSGGDFQFPVSFDAAGNFSFPTPLPLDGSADGDHTVVVRVTDATGATAEAQTSFTLDTRPPTVVIQDPAAGLLTSHNVTVDGQVTDNRTSVASMQGEMDAGQLFNVTFDAAGHFSFPTDLPLDGSADGTHTVHVRATDKLGNVSGFVDRTFTLDSQPPLVTIQAPSAGLLTNHDVTVTGQAVDALSGVASVERQIDSGSFVTVPFDAAGHFSFATGLVLDGSQDGVHTVHLRATDKAGNVSKVVSDSFTLDSQPPVVTIQSPAAGLLTSTNPTFTGQATDNLSGVASVEWRIDNGPLASLPFDASGNFAFTTGLALDGSADGAHTIHVRSTDKAGNVSGFVDRSFTLDSQPPLVTIQAPTPGLLTNHDVTVIGQAVDSLSPVVSVERQIDAGSFTAVPFDAAGHFSFATGLLLDGSQDGVHTVRLRATDKAGNESQPVSTSFTLDSQPPVMTIQSPSAGLLTNHDVTVTGQAADVVSGVASVERQIDDGSFVTVPFDASGHFRFATGLPLDGSKDGQHTVHLRATDKAGNVSKLIDTSFTLDSQPPVVTV
jgi:hypothetical protein